MKKFNIFLSQTKSESETHILQLFYTAKYFNAIFENFMIVAYK